MIFLCSISFKVFFRILFIWITVYFLCFSHFASVSAASNRILSDSKQSERNALPRKLIPSLKEQFNSNTDLEVIQCLKATKGDIMKKYVECGTTGHLQIHRMAKSSISKRIKLNRKNRKNIIDSQEDVVNLRGGGTSLPAPSSSPNSESKMNDSSTSGKTSVTALPLVYKTFVSTEIFKTLKTLFFISLWYALNVHYNLVNKRVLNNIALPYTVATLQLFIGSLSPFFFLV